MLTNVVPLHGRIHRISIRCQRNPFILVGFVTIMLELFVKATEGDEHLLLADSNIDDEDVNRFKLIIQELVN